MALSILLDDVEVVGSLAYGSLRIIRTAGDRPGRTTFTLNSWGAPALNGTCVIADGATLFSGNIASYRSTETVAGFQQVTITALDAGTVPTAREAPFALIDTDPETAYTHYVDTYANPYEWWRLGEASGTTATGEEGVRNGTYVNTPTLGVTGAMTTGDTAITLNGTDEYVDCGNAMLAGQTDWSIAVWAKSSSKAASQMMYSEREVANTAPLLQFFLNVNGRPEIRHHGNTGVQFAMQASSGDWCDGEWHLFAVVMEDFDVALYVDGVQVASDTETSLTIVTVGTMQAWIGREATGSFPFNGSLDEVMIWRTAVDRSVFELLYAMRDGRLYGQFAVDATYDPALLSVRNPIVTTYDAGVLAGDRIGLRSIANGVIYAIYVVQEVETTWRNATTPVYVLTCGDAPLHLAAAFP